MTTMTLSLREAGIDNVCLNATVTAVSSENDSEPASKALDGTSLNGSKWCATNMQSATWILTLAVK